MNQLDGEDAQTEYVKGLKEKAGAQEAVLVKASKAVTDEIKNIADLARQLTVVQEFQPKKRQFQSRALPVSNQSMCKLNVTIEKRKASSVKLESTPPKRRKLNPKPAPKRKRSIPASGSNDPDPRPAKRRRKSAPVLGLANVEPLRRSTRKRRSAPTPDPKAKRVL